MSKLIFDSPRGESITIQDSGRDPARINVYSLHDIYGGSYGAYLWVGTYDPKDVLVIKKPIQIFVIVLPELTWDELMAPPLRDEIATSFLAWLGTEYEILYQKSAEKYEKETS